MGAVYEFTSSHEKGIQSLTLDKKHKCPGGKYHSTSKYLEVRFDHIQNQINGINNNIKGFHTDVNRDFEMMEKGIEMVDKRFDKIIAPIDRLTDNL